jgi:uncharacterized protein YecT (DUF1311 family)
MIGRTLGVAALIMAVSTNVWAQGEKQDSDKVEYSKAYHECLEKSEGITVNLRDCSGAESDRLDKELNAVYRDLSAKSNPDSRASLVRAERAWIAYRSAHGDYEGEAERGGTLALIIMDSCYLDMTARRLKELRSYVEHKHGFKSED